MREVTTLQIKKQTLQELRLKKISLQAALGRTLTNDELIQLLIKECKI